MNIFRLVASLLILTLICSSALAISKGDLMTYYRTTPVSPEYPENNPVPADDVKTDTPTYQPTSPISVLPFQKWLNPFPKPAIPSSGFVKPTMSPGSQAMNKSASTGYVPERLPSYSEEDKKYIFGNFSDEDDGGPMCGPPINYIKVETERPGEILTDSRTGEPYPVITDIRGNSFLAVEGCSG
jgi:hypothetical protein